MRTADVFLDGYRPETLAKLGFGKEDLIATRPGLIYVSVNCFGSGGPLASGAGWEQVAQAVTGICHTNGLCNERRKTQTGFRSAVRLHYRLPGSIRNDVSSCPGIERATEEATTCRFLSASRGCSFSVTVSLA